MAFATRPRAYQLPEKKENSTIIIRIECIRLRRFPSPRRRPARRVRRTRAATGRRRAHTVAHDRHESGETTPNAPLCCCDGTEGRHRDRSAPSRRGRRADGARRSPRRPAAPAARQGNAWPMGGGCPRRSGNTAVTETVPAWLAARLAARSRSRPSEAPRRAHGSPGVTSSLLYHGHHGCQQTARLTTGGRTGVTAAQGMCGSLPKFRVIPRECPVEARQLMIICPYPFCNASCKCGLGRPVDLVRRRSLLEGEGRGEVPMMSGSAVRYPVQVQVAPEAARCERSA